MLLASFPHTFSWVGMSFGRELVNITKISINLFCFDTRLVCVRQLVGSVERRTTMMHALPNLPGWGPGVCYTLSQSVFDLAICRWQRLSLLFPFLTVWFMDLLLLFLATKLFCLTYQTLKFKICHFFIFLFFLSRRCRKSKEIWTRIRLLNRCCQFHWSQWPPFDCCPSHSICALAVSDLRSSDAPTKVKCC